MARGGGGGGGARAPGRPVDDDDVDARRATTTTTQTTTRKTPEQMRRTAMKRSGRHALSIDRFVNARKSTYDKRERIKRDKAEAAATRAKYERLQKKLTGTYERREEFDPEVYERRLAIIDDPELARGDEDVERREREERERRDAAEKARARDEDADEDGRGDDDAPEEQRNYKGKKKKKKFDHLAAAWKKGQAERDAREEQRKDFLEQKAARDAARRDQLAKRSSQKQLMRKKTKRGQPVMKHRVQNILDKLHAEAAAVSSGAS